MGNGFRYTALGREYYKRHPVRAIVKIPVVAVRISRDRWVGGVEETRYFPMEEIEVPPMENQNAQIAYAEERVRGVLETYEVIQEGTVVYWDSIPWVLAPGPWLTSLQHTTFNAEGVPTTEAILDRPTRGLPLIPYELKSSWGLCGEALKDTGECVPRQMAMLCGLTWDECCELLDSAYDQLTPAQRKGLQGRPWREVGVPPRMVAIACKQLNLSFYLLWRGRLIHKAVPTRSGNHYVTLYVDGHHSFFYEDPDVKRTITKMKVSKPKRYSPTRVLLETEHLDTAQIERWDGTLRSGTFWVGAEEINETRLWFVNKSMSPKVCLSNIDTVSCLKWKCEDTKLLVLRSRPTDRSDLDIMAAGLGMVYTGQTRASLALASMLRTLRHGREKSRRITLSPCEVCGDVAEEQDHILRLASGGTNDASNLQPLCKGCHLAKTLSESAAPREVHIYEGVACPRTHDQFVMSPKTPQLCLFFRGPSRLRTVAIDVCKCRRSALVNYPYPIPILSVLDEPEPFDKSLGDYNFLTKPGPTEEAAFWNQIGYTGPRWYSKLLTESLMSRGIVQESDVAWILNATSHLPVGTMKTVFEELDRACDGLPDNYDVERQRKYSAVALLGLLSRQSRESWTCDTRTTDDDVVFRGPVVTRKVPDTDLTDYIWKTQLLTWRTNRALHQICLDGEHLAVAEAVDLARKHTQSGRGEERTERLLGVQVDAVHVSMQLREYENLVREAMTVLNPDGTRKFTVQVVDRPTPSPTGVIPTTECEVSPDEPWRDYTGYDSLRDIVLRGESVMVMGFGGCGKSTAVERVCEELKAKGKQVVKTAYTHLAASRIGGVTLHHFLSKYKTFKGTLIIDEVSQVPVALWAQIMMYLHCRVQFVLCGDFVSQFQPAYNQWRLNPHVDKSMADTNALKMLCGYNRVEFKVYHRGNADLYSFWRGLLDLPVAEAVALARARFPRLPDEPKWHLVVSNAHRVSLLRKCGASGTPVETFDGLLEVGPGSRMVGRQKSKRVVNGLFYEVVALDLLRDEFGKEIQVEPCEFLNLSVATALVYYSSQGRTLDGRVRLHVSSRHMSTRALVVGLQRCTHTDLIDVW